MANKTLVKIDEIVKHFGLDILYMPEKEVFVERNEVNRPGLSLAGFFDHFEPQRVQIIGKFEKHYLDTREECERKKRVDDFLSKKPVALIFTTNLEVDSFVTECAAKYEVPVLRAHSVTSEFMADLIAFLTNRLAPMVSRHGVMVEVYGEGVFIMGDSGIGKSETAIELVKRGHRLVADDAVDIKKCSATTLVASAPELIKHYIELRGIGIVDVRRIFGMGAVKDAEKIDMAILLEPWENGKEYNRFGLDSEYIDIMGIKIPLLTIPVKPGRNLAIIIEIAAMNHRQKKMGYDTAQEFNKKLMAMYGGEEK